MRICGIEPHRGKFLSACHFLSGLPFLYQMRKIYDRKQLCHLHVHRGMQDATSGIFKPYLFATFSGFTTSLFALHPHRIVHFLTLGLLQHAVLVNVGGLEPPLTEPKSVVLPLHYTSFIGLSRLSELRNLRVQLVPHVYPSVRWYESLRFVLWAGVEPA